MNRPGPCPSSGRSAGRSASVLIVSYLSRCRSTLSELATRTLNGSALNAAVEHLAGLVLLAQPHGEHAEAGLRGAGSCGRRFERLPEELLRVVEQPAVVEPLGQLEVEQPRLRVERLDASAQRVELGLPLQHELDRRRGGRASPRRAG